MPNIPLTRVTEPWWDDKPLAIVGSGPSLNGFDFEHLRIPGIRVLAVKEVIRDIPFADVLFALDRPWMGRRADWMRTECKAEIWLAPTGLDREHVPLIEGANYLKLSRFEGFSNDPEIIQSGGNSGFGAVNLAYLKRAKDVVLFGFDYAERGQEHHYSSERYHWYPAGRNARYWKNWGENFTPCVPQIKAANMAIINACPDSTLAAFPKVSIDEGLALLRRHAIRS